MLFLDVFGDAAFDPTEAEHAAVPCLRPDPYCGVAGGPIYLQFHGLCVCFGGSNPQENGR